MYLFNYPQLCLKTRGFGLVWADPHSRFQGNRSLATKLSQVFWLNRSITFNFDKTSGRRPQTSWFSEPSSVTSWGRFTSLLPVERCLHRYQATSQKLRIPVKLPTGLFL